MIKFIFVIVFALLLSCTSGKENCLSNATYTKPGTPDSCDLLPGFVIAYGKHLDIPYMKDTVDFFLLDCLLYKQKVNKCNSESDIIPTID
jgi:hypothetical protein